MNGTYQKIKSDHHPLFGSQYSIFPSFHHSVGGPSKPLWGETKAGSLGPGFFNRFWQKITKEIISRVNILPIGEKEVLVAGDIRAGLRKTGQIIGLEDVLIAASAITNQFTVITANLRPYSRIRGLKVENWLEQI